MKHDASRRNLYIQPLHIHNPYIIQICSGLTRGRVLNGELYTQRF